MIFDITSIVTEASLDCFVSGTYTEQKINDKREYTENNPLGHNKHITKNSKYNNQLKHTF